MKTKYLLIAIAALVVTTSPSYALTKAEAKAKAEANAEAHAKFQAAIKVIDEANAAANAADVAYAADLAAKAAEAKTKWVRAAAILKAVGGDGASENFKDDYEDAKHDYEFAKSRADNALVGLPDAKLGMTEQQVRETNWGAPTSVNRTTTVNHVREQWVYTEDDGTSRRFLYFDNGRLTAIQN